MKINAQYTLFSLVFIAFSYISCKRQDMNSTKKMGSKSSREALINTAFPEIKATTLSKQNIVFPKDVMGKPTIICVAFVGAAQSLVDTWTTPILAKYPNQEVNYYEVPMIKTGYKFMRRFIDGGMRSGVPKALHGNVATYYGNLKTYKSDMKVADVKNCYVFLLDKTGVIQYVSDSSSDAGKLTALFGAIDRINGL
jgi:ATP10 protein